jgi:type IV pilus assembly protein PilV
MKQQQQGMSLVEVMVAVVILGLGLLGLGAMQSKAVAMNQSAYYRSIAADLGTNLADRIRAVRTPYVANADANPKPGKPPDFSKCPQKVADLDLVECANQDADRATYQGMTNAEMQEWLTAVRAQLPSATYTLIQEATSLTSDYLRYTLTITWLDNRQESGAAANTTYTVVIE